MSVTILRYLDVDGPHTVTLDRATTSIGRSPDRDVVLRDALVSRRHAIITREGDTWVIADQNSTHGTFLNSAQIRQATLKSGDVLQFGSLDGKRVRFLVQQDGGVIAPPEENSLHDFLTSMQERRSPSHGLGVAADEIEQLSWLIRAARRLNEGLVIDEILKVLLQLTLQLTGYQRGFVFLSSEGKLRFAQGLSSSGKALNEDRTISRKAIQRAIANISKFSVSDAQSDEIARGWSSVIVNEIRSIYCIPLRKRVPPGQPRQLIGLLYLDRMIEPGHLTDTNQQLLDTIATEASALVQNALLAEAEQQARQAREELALAARIHSGLMSTTLPDLSYAKIFAKTVPCLAIGGDFYDVIALEDCVCVAIVDVSGKGVSAAIVAATLQGIIHAQLLGRHGLQEIAAVINRFLCTRNVGKYATLVILKLYPDGRLEYINCGHLLPLVIYGKSIRRLEASNFIVGLLPEATYFATEDVLQAGERLLLVTDGITEAEDSEGRQFEESWLSAVTHCRHIGEILDMVAQFQAPKPAEDDRTLVEIRYLGPA
jgi:serine phosphatase RsbU (regulator of sigma subunit)